MSTVARTIAVATLRMAAMLLLAAVLILVLLPAVLAAQASQSG